MMSGQTLGAAGVSTERILLDKFLTEGIQIRIVHLEFADSSVLHSCLSWAESSC